MVKPLDRPGSATSITNGATNVQNPKTAAHSSLGKVSPTDTDPFLSDRNLGQHLTSKGVKNWILTFLRHPKATFDLITGKLWRLRGTSYTKYLKELSNLSSSEKDWEFVIDECCRLKQGQNPSTIQEIEVWERLALLEQQIEAPKKNNKNNSRDLSKQILPGNTNFQILHQQFSPTNTTTATKAEKNRWTPLLSTIEAVSESMELDELKYLFSQLEQNPENLEQWASFDEFQEDIRTECNPEEANRIITTFFDNLLKSRPDNATISQRRDDYQLQNPPNDQKG